MKKSLVKLFLVAAMFLSATSGFGTSISQFDGIPIPTCGPKGCMYSQAQFDGIPIPTCGPKGCVDSSMLQQ